MTVWLADRNSAASEPPIADFAQVDFAQADFAGCEPEQREPEQREPEIAQYRAAVRELVAEFADYSTRDAQSAEHILARRLYEEQFTAVLEATPEGRDETVARLLFEVRNFTPGPRSAASVAALIRISMLAQIDAVWWGEDPGYATDADVLDAPELIDLDELAAAGQLRFSYRHQADTLLSRAARSAERRTLPGRSPRTAGLWLAKTRPQAVTWLNQLADEFARIAPPDTPALWVTSLARSVAHQRRLKELGYVALLPSAHCVGYAFDVEMAWYRRFHAHRRLRGLLLDRQRADEVNVIDEGQAWHVCLRPGIVQGPRSLRRA